MRTTLKEIYELRKSVIIDRLNFGRGRRCLVAKTYPLLVSA
jgi:hypothetical protein